MSFWATSSGGNAAQDASNEFETGGGFEIIPDKSTVLAEIDQAGWAQDQNFNNYISLRWNVLKPEEVAGRKVFQKLWVEDLDPNAKDEKKGMEKRDKALNMLAAIDANAGGKLARKGSRPTDDELALALIGKPMAIFLRIWENRDKEPGGNWVAGVYPKNRDLALGKPAAPKSGGGGSSMSASRGGFGEDLGDDIPFITADCPF